MRFGINHDEIDRRVFVSLGIAQYVLDNLQICQDWAKLCIVLVLGYCGHLLAILVMTKSDGDCGCFFVELWVYVLQ